MGIRISGVSGSGLERTSDLFQAPFTICGWFLFDDSANFYRVFELASVDNDPGEWGLFLNTGEVRIDAVFAGTQYPMAAATMIAGEPFFAAITDNGTNVRGHFMSPGGALVSSQTGVSSPGVTIVQATVGYRTFFGGSAIVGALSNLLVYSAALSLEQLASQANSVVPLYGDVHLWTPCWRVGDTVDYSGNGRDWTENGTLADGEHAPVGWGDDSGFLEIVVAGGTAYHEEPTESMSLSEAVAVTKHSTVEPAESMSLSETVAAVFGAHLDVAESVSLSEVLATLYEAHQEISETMGLSEVLAATMGAHIAVSESMSLSEALTELYAANVAISESMSLSEVLTNPQGSAYVIPISESMSLSESVAASLGAHVESAESMSLSEALATVYGASVPISESMSLSESLAASFGAHLALSETLALSDVVAASQGSHVGLAETTGLSETVEAVYGARVAPAETMSLSEVVAVLPAIETGARPWMFLVQ